MNAYIRLKFGLFWTSGALTKGASEALIECLFRHRFARRPQRGARIGRRKQDYKVQKTVMLKRTTVAKDHPMPI